MTLATAVQRKNSRNAAPRERRSARPHWIGGAGGKGLELHGVALPIEFKRAFTLAVANKTNDLPPDIRCGVTLTWRGMRDRSADVAMTESGL